MNVVPPETVAWLADYDALVNRVGLTSLNRTQIEFRGRDRASFLHNLCTNEIKKLPAGAGCEAFVTSVQGRTLGHGYVFAEEAALIFESEQGQAEKLLKHFEHYLVCEDVTLVDRTPQWAELLLAGPQAASLLQRLWNQQPPTALLAHTTLVIDDRTLRVRRVDFTAGGGYLIGSGRQHADWLEAELVNAGARRCVWQAWEAARIEQGTPRFGIDLNDKNLPQELSRDEQAISFVKGCYLGQETVARLDALGHVNKSLVGMRFDSAEVPTPGLELKAGDLLVGQVTSASYSPRAGAPLALGYVRQGHNQPGARIETAIGNAEIVALPLGSS